MQQGVIDCGTSLSSDLRSVVSFVEKRLYGFGQFAIVLIVVLRIGEGRLGKYCIMVQKVQGEVIVPSKCVGIYVLLQAA